MDDDNAIDKSRFREEKLVLMFTKVITKTVVSILTEISSARKSFI